MLKPVGCVPEHAWACEVFATWESTDVRVPEPIMPKGREVRGWSVDGWGAHVLLAGRDLDIPREIEQVKQASDAFHRVIRALPRPDFLESRDDPWAFGDRLAWEGASRNRLMGSLVTHVERLDPVLDAVLSR